MGKIFEYSCDQVVSEWCFRKKYHNSFHLVVLLPWVLNKNEKGNTNYHCIFVSFKSQLYPKQGSSHGDSHSRPVWPKKLSIISPCLGKVKVLAILSDIEYLIILVDIQRSHENGKWVSCVSTRVYILSNKKLLCCSTLIKLFHHYSRDNRGKAS